MLIIKPSITFLTEDSDVQLIGDVGVIVTCMTDNPNYTEPDPPIADVSAALTDFTTAYNNRLNGSAAMAIKNEKRDILVPIVRNLAVYVGKTCNGVLSVLLSSGFPIQKPTHQPVGIPAAPDHVTLSLGNNSGELDAQVPPVSGAIYYCWRIMTAADPNTVINSGHSTPAKFAFTALKPGETYIVDACAAATAGQSQWTRSNPQMVV